MISELLALNFVHRYLNSVTKGDLVDFWAVLSRIYYTRYHTSKYRNLILRMRQGGGAKVNYKHALNMILRYYDIDFDSFEF